MAATPSNIADRVGQMPDTDKDLELQQEAAKAGQQPDPKRLGTASKVTGPDPASAERLFADILAGGRATLDALIDLVREPEDPDFKSYKAGYVLHGVVLLAGRPGNHAQRRLVAESLAAHLNQNRHSNALKALLIRELRILAGPSEVPAIGAQLANEALCEDAIQALLTLRDGAAAPLRAALPQSKGACRISILRALGDLRDANSVEALRRALADADSEFEIRQAAAWALANLGDADSASALMRIADAAHGWDRTLAARHCMLLADRLAESGRAADARKVYAHLRDLAKDPKNHHLADAADQALKALP